MTKQNKYAIVYTWPGGCQNAESEVIRRILVAAKNIGAKFDVISKEGFILDDVFNKTDTRIHDNEYDFMVTIHYDDVKLWDSFYYHTLWNPPLIPMQYAQYPDILKNIISNDDFLIYDDGGMSTHLKAMLIDTPRNLDGASSLVASFPATSALKTNLENPTLFYCGINWEKMIGAKPRHEGLFKLLDGLDDVKIYGPASTWTGYKNYHGSIPFDGFSLIEEINKCGVVLALSSDFHYRAGAATNRVYEGCAAGAVVISDTNRFIKEHFGDSVLYIDFDKDNPQNMFEQIKKHLDWIKNNKEAALKLAQKSQKIFLEKFTLEKQLKDIIANHENRTKAVADALYAKNNKSVTLATLFIDSVNFGENEQKILENTVRNIDRQTDKSIVLAICCDKRLESDIQSHLKSLKTNVNAQVCTFYMFDDMNYKWLSHGQMLFDVIHKIPHDYLCVLDGYEIMFSDHITTLKRTLEDNPDKIVAHSGTFLDSKDTNRYRILNDSISAQEIYDCVWPNGVNNSNGAFLMDKKIESYLSDCICPYLDGLEVSALLNIAHFKHHDKFAYSKRISCGCDETLVYKFPMTIDYAKQVNFIHGLVVYDISELKANHVKQRVLSESCMEAVLRLNQYRIRNRIALIRLRNLFVWDKSKRHLNHERIKKYKSQLQMTDLV